MPMDEAVIDWQSLGTVQTADGQPRTRVVVVAVRREMVDGSSPPPARPA